MAHYEDIYGFGNLYNSIRCVFCLDQENHLFEVTYTNPKTPSVIVMGEAPVCVAFVGLKFHLSDASVATEVEHLPVTS